MPGTYTLREAGKASVLCGSKDSLEAIITLSDSFELPREMEERREINCVPSPALPGAGSTGLLHTTAELSAVCPRSPGRGLVGSPAKKATMALEREGVKTGSDAIKSSASKVRQK